MSGDRLQNPADMDLLALWFNLDLAGLAAGLQELGDQPEEPESSRLAFLRRALAADLEPSELEEFFQRFRRAGDQRAAAAVAGAGVALVHRQGRDFSGFKPWHRRISALLSLESELDPLAKAYLLIHKGIAEFLGQGATSRAGESYQGARALAQMVPSPSLMVFATALWGYPLLNLGEFSRARVAFFDAAPLCHLKAVAFLPRAVFCASWVAFSLLAGEKQAPLEQLEEVLADPRFQGLPPAWRLLVERERLMAARLSGDSRLTAKLARHTQQEVIPTNNLIYHTYLHLNLALAALALAQPDEALVRAQEALELARRNRCPYTEALAALVLGQSLADLGRDEKALGHLEGSLALWRRGDYRLLEAAGHLERAALLARAGQIRPARLAYDQAAALIPRRHLMNPGRGPEFLQRLHTSLFPDKYPPASLEEARHFPVRIQALGRLRVHFSDRCIQEGGWRGQRTKELLKALVVLGGQGVPADRLMDLIWPEALGDKAAQNFKAAVSRLRRLGLNEGEKPLPWIQVSEGRVSFNPELVLVDAILFKKALSSALHHEDDLERLRQVLELYHDDFLAGDFGPVWVDRHRETLRDLFIKGAAALARRCLEKDCPETALPYLERAREKDPLDEGTYEWLMRVHLALGYPSRALITYQKACRELDRELGVQPGPALQELAQRAGRG